MGLLLLGTSLGCATGSPDSESTAGIVAYLDGRPQTLADLERYLESNLLMDDEGDDVSDDDASLVPAETATASDELNTVKSRLFDAFIDERLLLAEAERRGLEVSDLEIEAYLGVGRDHEESAITESRWQAARCRLMIQKLQEIVSRGQPPLTEAQVRDYLEQNRESLDPERRRLSLRSLMVPTLKEARRIHREIGRGRMTFAEAVAAHATRPSQGVSVELAWESLPAEHRAALEGLRPGQVSRPVELHGEVYVFQLESWLKADGQSLRLARQGAEAQRRQLAWGALLRDLRQRVRVELKLGALPFDYVPETQE